MNLKKLQKTIESIGEGLGPEDDWMPALILENKNDASVFGFAGDSMASDFTKDLIAGQIIKVIREFKPHTACFVTTAWTLNWEGIPNKDARLKDFISGRLRVSQQPDRIEIVSAYCYGEQGENEGEVLMMGYIKRFKNSHPKITKWKIMGGPDDVTATGRFPDAVKAGFKKLKGK